MRKRKTSWPKTFAATVATLLAAVVIGGCGDEPSDTKEDDIVEDAGLDAGQRFNFQDDDTAAADDSASSSGSSGASSDGGSSGGSDSAGSTDAGKAGPVDAGHVEITSCKGHCGIYLEENQCHCTPACVDKGDCCADFQLMCTCKANKDCDDANACTTDSCSKGHCKQIPFQNCCQADNECKGGSACKIAKCLDGTCSLVDKDCSDGVACTADLCEAKTGKCSNALAPNKCLIDGFCASKDDKKPGAVGCEICQPAVDANKWTAKKGTCLIDGKCYAANDAHPTDKCLQCDPAKGLDKWSVKTGWCHIGKACYVSGQNPTGVTCASCAPSKSQKEWTGAPGKCAVQTAKGVQCIDKGKPHPDIGACSVCDPSTSTSGTTLADGWCLIDNQCVSKGKAGLAEDICSVCDPAKSTDKWTPKKAGVDCNDGDPCTIDSICNAAGKCVGKSNPGCCKKDDDCADLAKQAGPCEVPICLKSTGTCELQKLGADKCCTSGKCCDVAKSQVKPQGTPCSTTVIGSEYRCDGQKAEKRSLFPGCTGSHGSKCSSSAPNKAPGAWTVTKTCPAKTKCVLKSSKWPPTCT